MAGWKKYHPSKCESHQARFDIATQQIREITAQLNGGQNPSQVALSAADQTRFDAATKQILSLNAQISDAEKKRIADQSKMDAEANGAPLPGTTGRAGPGGQYLLYKSYVATDDRTLAVLQSSLKSQQQIVDQIVQQSQQMQAASLTRADANSVQLRAQLLAAQAVVDEIAQQERNLLSTNQSRANIDGDKIAIARQTELDQTTAEITKREQSRDTVFAGYEQEFLNNPNRVKMEDETGVFQDMHHLATFLSNPKTGDLASSFAKVVGGVILAFETLAITMSVIRLPTPSEILDAEIRAGVLGGAERRAMGQLREIIPMRKALRHLASTPWEQMKGAFRPDDGPTP